MKFIDRSFPFLFLLVLGLYTYAFFFAMPYLGFRYAGDGTITQVLVDNPPEWLQVGSRISWVAGAGWESLEADLARPFFPDLAEGEAVALSVSAVDQRPQTVSWRPPTNHRAEILERINSQWWLPYIFWLAGSLAWLVIRPRNAIRALLVAFNMLTALFLVLGSGPSITHLWFSAPLLRFVTWLMVPVYLHLHWILPGAFRRLPVRGVIAGYAAAALIGIAEAASLIPSGFFQVGFLLAVAGSLGILLAKLILLKEHRRAAGFILTAFGFVFLPAVLMALAVQASGGGPPPFILGGALLSLPALPGAYFYLAYRDQLKAVRGRLSNLPTVYVILVLLVTALGIWLLNTYTLPTQGSTSPAITAPLIGLSLLSLAVMLFPFLSMLAASGAIASPKPRGAFNLELRTNRILVPFLFFSLLAGLNLILIPLMIGAAGFPGAAVLIGSGFAVLSALVTYYLYTPFRLMVEDSLFGISGNTPRDLKDQIAGVTSVLTLNDLANVLANRVLPPLFVRQSALVYLNLSGQPVTLYLHNVAPQDLPDWRALSRLSREAPADGAIIPDSSTAPGAEWIRLLLPLRLAGELQGMWILGRRDPDDAYSYRDVEDFRLLADQASMSLAHILRTNQLQAIYQADIEEEERERALIGRGLHDQVLNQLASLAMMMHADRDIDSMMNAYEDATGNLRRYITLLRPGILEFGLGYAVHELAIEQNDLGQEAAIQVDLPNESPRFETTVESNAYRIIQQLIDNALEHARASTIRVSGAIDEGAFVILVEDDGIGFDYENLDMATLLVQKHFGLVGMIERAAVIGAALEFESVPGTGTRATLRWENGSS